MVAALLYGFKLLVCGIERAWPRRPFHHGALNRWAANLVLLVMGIGLLDLVFAPGAATGVAWWCEQNDFGVFQQYDVPTPVAATLGWLVIDLVMWLQHWVQHKG